MKSILLAAALAAAPCFATLKPPAAEAALDAVNVFTGTSNSRWMLFPGATLPFGLVKLSPDNQTNVWNGGYEYSVHSISGFSHLHAFSLSGLSIMPVTGPMATESRYRVFPGAPDGPFGGMWTSGYRSRFDRATERGSPGYYAVDLLDWKVRAELSATRRCGVMRFGFPTTDDAHLLLDFAFPTEEQTRILGVTVTRTGPAEITGTIRQANNYTGEYSLHFVLRADRAIGSLDGWQRAPLPADSATNYGTAWRAAVDYRTGVSEFSGQGECGITLNFQTVAGQPLQVHTGLSLVGVEQARLNLDTELASFGWDFDAVVRGARAEWASILGAIEISGGTADQRATFYTNLYRAYAAKSILHDVDGSFRDAAGQTGHLTDPRGAVYSSDAFWGAQWTLFPLWTLTSPATASSWIHFFLEAAERGGWMPQAPVNGAYSPVMVAQHHQSLIVSAYQKGIRDFDAERAFRAIKHDLTTPGVAMPNGGYAGNRNLAAYLAHGFVPVEDGPSSNTFEYAYDDWAAAQFALALGKAEDHREFLRRSGSWRNGLDPATGHARRRHADGSWVEPQDLHHYGTEGGWNGPGFVEGSAWVYSWFVPHDPGALVARVGRNEFNCRLEEGFARGWVDLTNETNLHAPFLFNYSGKPWLTQQHTRRALATGYSTAPLGGWIGEEDEGQLGALYVLWAIGLFEIEGGCSVKPYYDLTSPLFDSVVLHLDKQYYGGRDFTIETRRQHPDDVYIQSARLNGQPLDRAWLYHAEIVAGGTLEFELGSEPNPAWATSPATAQPLLRKE